MPAKKPKPVPNITLNEEQQAVVSAREGIYAVYAGPGSGKTATCVKRMAAIIQEGVDPNTVLALSFTATAAKNLRDRIEALTGPLSIIRTAGSMTLHSLALKFAEEERDVFPFTLAESVLASEPVAAKLCGDAGRKLEVDPRSLRSAVSLWKRNRVRPSAAIKSAEDSLNPSQLKLALAYKKYDAAMRESGVMDFDSLMYEMVEILEKKADVRARWAYKFVTCDESQDCCLTDWQLLKLLSEKHGNLLCVGDPGQSVFGFRGASPKLFLNMEEMFPAVQKLYLAANYRSSKKVVDFLKQIGPVRDLAEKFHTNNEDGVAPLIRGFLNSADESKWVVDQIKEAIWPNSLVS